ncbi:MAG: PEP-CTERM sorting domain-containing protein, partial [Deltaproteobacteria bacterium]
LGHPYTASSDLLVVADGNLDLYAVPEPLSLLLVGSVGAGLLVLRRLRG